MADIAYPTTDLYLPDSIDWTLRVRTLIATSSLNGGMQTSEIPGTRWEITMNYEVQSGPNRAYLEAFWASIRGQVNRVLLWHFARPAPRGTMRGSPVTNSSTSAGATSIAIATTTGNTLLAGDMIKTGSQLFMVTADATSSGGVLTAIVSPPVRATISTSSAVTWDRPSVPFVLADPGVTVPYRKVTGEAFSVTLLEML